MKFIKILGLLVCLPLSVQALTVDKSSVTFNPKKSDSFLVTGHFDSLSPGDNISLTFGAFSQTLPVSAFTQKNGVYKYKGAKNASGVAQFVLNTTKNTFQVSGKNIILSSLKNPLAVHLVTGAFDECSMPRFLNKGKSWQFNGKKQTQSLCQISDVPQAAPSGFLTDTSTTVRVQARIKPDPLLDKNSVSIFEVDPVTLEPTGDTPLCSLKDSGNVSDGDDISGDNVFSCNISFNEPSPRKIVLIVQASLGTAAIFSPSFNLDVAKSITTQEATTVVNDQDQAKLIWEKALADFGDTKKARTEAIKQIQKLDGVKAAGLAQDGLSIWIEYDSGVMGGLILNPEGTRGGMEHASRTSKTVKPSTDTPPALFSNHAISPVKFTNNHSVLSKYLKISDEDTPVGNNKILIWDAYNHQFAPYDEGPGLKAMFEGSQCPSYDVTYLQDTAATVDSVRTFSDFGTVILVTHGGLDQDGQVVFLTDETADLSSILNHAVDLMFNRITVMGNVFAIRPSFITSLGGNFEDSIIYNGSCQSSANNTMVNAFIGKGVKSYFGYTRVVNSDFAQSAATQLFTNLVEKQMNTGDAFSPVTPKVDPTAPNATFVLSGDAKTGYSGKFRNGGFETGDLSAWSRAGDGRVISSLGGEFNPTEGAYMGLISTGLGYTTSSGSIEQNFCLAKSATQLSFDWNFSSEEFLEYCGSIYDDSFDVDLISADGTTSLFHTSVNGLCGTALSPTGFSFDQGGVYSTGWLPKSIDVSGIAAANAGKGVKLRFSSSDQGDSIYDTAILIDNIKFEEAP